MNLNLFISNRAQKNFIAIVLGLALLPAAMGAFPSPQWMQGGHSARITGIVPSADGTMIASSSEDGTIKIWSTNGTLLRTLPPITSPVKAIAWSQDGSKIAAGSYVQGQAGKGLTYLYQAPNGWASGDISFQRFSTNRYGHINALAFSRDNTMLACGNNGGSNLVYSTTAPGFAFIRACAPYNLNDSPNNTPYHLNYEPARPSGVTSVSFSPSGLLATACEEGTFRIFNSSWSQVWSSTNTTSNHRTNAIVAFSADGSLLVSASLDKTIKIWNASSWTLQQSIANDAGICSVAFNPDGQTIVSGGQDGVVKIWDLSGNCLQTIAAHSLPVYAAAFTTDGSRIISGGDDCAIRIWSTNGTAVCSLGAQNFGVETVVFSPDGTLCASIGDGQGIQVRNATNGSLVLSLFGHTNFVSSVAFSPDSTMLASGGGVIEPTIKIWRLSDGALIRTIDATINGVTALAWSPDGDVIACGTDSVEQKIQLWSAEDGSSLATLDGHTNGVTALTFSPDGSMLASGGRRPDNAVKIWAMPSGPVLYSFSGTSNNVEALAFSPDGNLIASASGNSYLSPSNQINNYTPLAGNYVKIWQLSDSSVRNFNTGINPVTSVAFSADGATLAVSDRESIKFWNVANATLTETVTQDAFRVTSIAFSPNANLFLYGREDGTLLLSPNTYGAMGQPALTFVAPITGSEMGVSATVQPLTRYVIQYSTDLNAGWNYATQGSSTSNTWNVSFPHKLPIKSEDNVFLRALTPQ